MFCKKCRNIFLGVTCTCREYACRHEYYTTMEDEKDTMAVWAKSPEAAAEKVVESKWIDELLPNDVNNIDETVEVVGYGTYWVTAHTEIKFEAKEIE